MQSDSFLSPANQRYGWLATISAVYAVLFEVFPVEADTIFALVRNCDVFTFCLVKATFLVAIIGPLMVYLFLTGSDGAKRAKARIATAVIVVTWKLACDLMYLFAR